MFFLLVLWCTQAIQCSLNSKNDLIDIGDPINYDEDHCPSLLSDLNIHLSSLTNVVLYNFPFEFRSITIQAQSPIEISSNLTTSHFYLQSTSSVTLNGFEGEFSCESCNVSFTNYSKLYSIQANTVTLTKGYLYQPLIRNLYILNSGYIISSNVISLDYLLNKGKLAILTIFPIDIQRHEGNSFSSFTNPTLFYSQNFGDVPSEDVVSLSKEKTQQTKINYDIHTIFIPGGITTVTFESIFNSIFLFNARIILQKPIKCTFFQAINSTIVFDGGNINTHILFLDNMSLLTKKPTAIYINTRNGTIHNVSATTIIPPTIPCTTIVKSYTPLNILSNTPSLKSDSLQLTLSYCTSPLKLFGKRQCTVVTNKDLIDLNGDVVYKEDYCPCSDCIFVINRTDPTGIIHSFTNIGGIHCTTKCSVQSKRSFSVGEVSGEFIEIMSPVIIEKYIPIQGGILLLPKDTVLIGVVNTNSMGRVIAKAIIHFCGNAVNGIRFEIHQSMAFLKQGNVWFQNGSIELKGNSHLDIFSNLIFSGDFRVEESIAPIRLLRQSTIEFKEKARIYFHTYVDTWNHDVLYLLFSEKRKFGSDVQLPPFYLVDKKTSEIHPGGRLFKECFGKWIMYKRL